MHPNSYQHSLIVFEGIDGTGKSTACTGVVDSIDQIAAAKSSPFLDDKIIELIAAKVHQTAKLDEISQALSGKRFGGAAQIDNFPYENPISTVHKRQFEDRYGIDLGAHLFILSAIFKDRAIQALLPYLNVVCDRYVYSLIAKHRTLGENADFFNYEALKVTKPDLLYLLQVDEVERKKRMLTRKNPTVFDLMPNVPGSRPWKINRELESFAPTIIDTQQNTHQQVIDRVLADLEKIPPTTLSLPPAPPRL